MGSLNLSEFVENSYTNKAFFNDLKFEEAVAIAVIGLNTVLNEGIPLHPLETQRECAKKWKQIGLGIMGLADMLIKLGIRYGSKEAIDICDKIGQILINYAARASACIASIEGSFERYYTDNIINTSFAIENFNIDTRKAICFNGLHNSQLLTTAPTGTLSTMLGISGGIEPIFANSYERTTKTLHGDKDVVYRVYTPIVNEYMKLCNVKDEKDLPNYFVTARDIPYEERIKMQAVWQKHIDASISSTVNLPENCTVEEIENLYIEAWKAGLKGITVFRENCERVAILNASAPKSVEQPEPIGLKRGEVRLVDNNALGLERHLRTGCGTLHCCAFFDKKTGELLETYLSKGSKGGCLSTLCGLSRMISTCARAGVDVKYIVDQLKSTVECPSYAVRHATHKDTSKGNCCPAAVGNALLDMKAEVDALLAKNKDVHADIVEVAVQESEETPKCPECGGPILHEGGCVVCKDCGWSRCG